MILNVYVSITIDFVAIFMGKVFKLKGAGGGNFFKDEQFLGKDFKAHIGKFEGKGKTRTKKGKKREKREKT